MYVLWGQHPIKSQDAQRSKFNAAKIVSISCVQLSVPMVTYRFSIYEINKVHIFQDDCRISSKYLKKPLKKCMEDQFFTSINFWNHCHEARHRISQFYNCIQIKHFHIAWHSTGYVVCHNVKTSMSPVNTTAI